MAGKVAQSKLDNPAIIKELCTRLASGEAMHVICQDKHMPSSSMVYARMGEDEDFRTIIAGAREAQQEFEADNIIRMADEATEEDWQVVKLRIWARQWRASKLAPKRYGDKLDLSSSDGSMTPAREPSYKLVD